MRHHATVPFLGLGTRHTPKEPGDVEKAQTIYWQDPVYWFEQLVRTQKPEYAMEALRRLKELGWVVKQKKGARRGQGRQP